MTEEFRDKLTSGVQEILKNATKICVQYKHSEVGLNHYLLAALERNGAIADQFIDSEKLAEDLRTKLLKGEIGHTVDLDTMLSISWISANQSESQRIYERHFIETLLLTAGILQTNLDQTPAITGTKPQEATQRKSNPVVGVVNSRILSKYGENLTTRALSGDFDSFLGREKELIRLSRILLHQRKRNPLIVGPAGVGKTEVVRGFAKWLTTDKAPDALRSFQIYQIFTSSILSDAPHVGDVESRMEKIIEEAKKPNIILFFDELHMMIGAGGNRNTDISNILKPALSSNQIYLIGATTDEEYEKYIASDKAFTRRFHTLRLHAMDKASTLHVMNRFKDTYYQKDTFHVEFEDGVFEHLYDYADVYLQDRHFPDKAIDLLEECASFALSVNKVSISKELAAQAVKEFVEMPVEMTKQVYLLADRFAEMKLFNSESIEKIKNRLLTTVERYDFQPSEPNLVALFCNDAMVLSNLFCEMVAEILFEDKQRIVEIDFSQMTERHSMSQIIGASHGYIGFGESLPLQALQQNPWSVLKLSDLDKAHPVIKKFIADSIRDGYFVLSNNRKINISETVVVITSSSMTIEKIQNNIGYKSKQKAEEENNDQKYLVYFDLDGIDFDEVIFSTPDQWNSTEWIKNMFLQEISNQLSKRHIYLSWEETLPHWFLSKGSQRGDWEDAYEEIILPQLIQLRQNHKGNYFLVSLKDDQPVVVELGEN